MNSYQSAALISYIYAYVAVEPVMKALKNSLVCAVAIIKKLMTKTTIIKL